MRHLTCCLLVLSAGLAAQSLSDDALDRTAVTKINSILLTLHQGNPAAVSRQLTDAMLAAAEDYHKPMRATVARFAQELANGLASKELPPRQVSRVSASIVEVLESAGVGTYKFKASVQSVREALVALGVPEGQARNVADRLHTIGLEVRGPEDMPVLQQFFRPTR